jgi:hypothetical protein
MSHIKQRKYQVKLGKPFELDVVVRFGVNRAQQKLTRPELGTRDRKTVRQGDKQHASAA